ncbi:hypothetical protein [Celeribacter indicus]|uniref:Uncharacterized protein n=1 Tax=Celeribacter indicus TaxID=1208324 RepID=A0A0B5DYY9_9RHOB|nr:hypothetical protein [Celeribacter indicus]AJE48643.1 hypothetical protein P73_3928 [Celeribacter indicus]SDX34779.1 hypothetical protein SAMN05443573_1237 [Celeribacter indicus]
MKYLLLPCLLLVAPAESFAGETTFMVGSRPWNFVPRSRETHLTMQMRGPDSTGQAGSGVGILSGGYPGYPVASSAYAVGNWIQIEMSLAEGAEGLIMVENHQTSEGSQQSLSDALGEIAESYQIDDATDAGVILE